MTRLFSHKDRPVHLGPFPLERLPRTEPTHPPRSREEPVALKIEDPGNQLSLANAMGEYINVMDRMREGQVAPDKARPTTRRL